MYMAVTTSTYMHSNTDIRKGIRTVHDKEVHCMVHDIMCKCVLIVYATRAAEQRD